MSCGIAFCLFLLLLLLFIIIIIWLQAMLDRPDSPEVPVTQAARDPLASLVLLAGLELPASRVLLASRAQVAREASTGHRARMVPLET